MRRADDRSGQRQLVAHALAEVAAGRVWATTVAGGDLGEGRFAIRWEPMAEPGAGALVIAQRASPQPSPGWLSEAVAQIGSTLDLTQTASEVVGAAVPGFADAAVLYVAERLLAAGELTSHRSGQGVAVRRLAARVSGPDRTAPAVLPPGGALLQRGHAQLAGDGDRRAGAVRPTWTTRPRSGPPAAPAAGRSPPATPPSWRCRSPPAAWCVGCAVFGRAAASPAFSPRDIALAGELAARAALGIDNARLYHRERRTALARCSAGCCPAGRRSRPGWRLRNCYLPVGVSVVGGDWHDIVPLPERQGGADRG